MAARSFHWKRGIYTADLIASHPYSRRGGDIRGPEQRRVERMLVDLADSLCSRLGMSRRSFLGTASGMAAAFLAMNAVHGALFAVDPAHAQARPPAAYRPLLVDNDSHEHA